MIDKNKKNGKDFTDTWNSHCTYQYTLKCKQKSWTFIGKELVFHCSEESSTTYLFTLERDGQYGLEGSCSFWLFDYHPVLPTSSIYKICWADGASEKEYAIAVNMSIFKTILTNYSEHQNFGVEEIRFQIYTREKFHS